MRRLCTEEERKILYWNWRKMCTGFAGLSAHARVRDYVWILPAIGIFNTIYIEIFALTLGEFSYFVFQIIGTMLVIYWVNLGLFNLRVINIKLKFLENESLYINGATIVKVKRDHKHIAYTYVEDDEYMARGIPYGVTIEPHFGKEPDAKVGDRLVLIYAGNPDEQSECSLQVMWVTPELEQKILGKWPEERDVAQMGKYLQCFPHPNAVKMQKEKRLLTPGEYEEAVARCRKHDRKVAITCFLFFYPLLEIVFCLGLGELWENILGGNRMHFYVGATVVIGVLLLLFFIFMLKQSAKDCTEVKYVQEILFKSIAIGRRGKTTASFLEWNGRKFIEIPDELSFHRADYGKVYVKYFTEKGMYAMMKK